MGIYCDLSDWLGDPRGDVRCADTCPTDTSERCELEDAHSGWHQGATRRWRRDQTRK